MNFEQLINKTIEIGIKSIKVFLIILGILALWAVFTGAYHQILSVLICAFLYWVQTKKVKK